MIRIKELDKPNLGKCNMNCDNVIHKKLLDYPMVEDCFSKTSFNVIVGKMGQGKTSLIVKLVKSVFQGCFEFIYVVMPENSRKSIEKDIFGRHLPENQLFDSLNVETLESIYKSINENTKEGFNSLLIIDDFQSEMKNKNILKLLERIITKQRHLRTSTFLLQQNYQKLDKSLRELIQNLIIFNVGKSQLEKIFEESIPIRKNLFSDIIDLAFQDSHDWVIINFRNGKIYKMFDEIIYTDCK
jgi:hypothetical protein